MSCYLLPGADPKRLGRAFAARAASRALGLSSDGLTRMVVGAQWFVGAYEVPGAHKLLRRQAGGDGRSARRVDLAIVVPDEEVAVEVVYLVVDRVVLGEPGEGLGRCSRTPEQFCRVPGCLEWGVELAQVICVVCGS
jgi:hypothetical protein